MARTGCCKALNSLFKLTCLRLSRIFSRIPGVKFDVESLLSLSLFGFSLSHIFPSFLQCTFFLKLKENARVVSELVLWSSQIGLLFHVDSVV